VSAAACYTPWQAADAVCVRQQPRFDTSLIQFVKDRFSSVSRRGFGGKIPVLTFCFRRGA
jgi:hypothetical protein